METSEAQDVRAAAGVVFEVLEDGYPLGSRISFKQASRDGSVAQQSVLQTRIRLRGETNFEGKCLRGMKPERGQGWFGNPCTSHRRHGDGAKAPGGNSSR